MIADQQGNGRAINWIHICRGVCEVIGCTPQQFGTMTLSEIVCVCTDVEAERKRESASPMELERYAKWWSELTIEERLWAEA